MKKAILISINFLLVFFLVMQLPVQSNAQRPLKRPHDWWQADWIIDSIPGISLNEAYDYLKGRKPRPVIVAIIDDCIDSSHEDLKNMLWTNKKEIAGNGIDDEHNGYVDDVHGWCFVCGKNNQSQNEELSSAALTYMTWEKKFENIDTNTLRGSLKIQYALYRTAKNVLFLKYRLFSLLAIVQADSAKFMAYIDNLSRSYKDSSVNKIPFSAIANSNSYDSCANLFFATWAKLTPLPVHISRLANRFKNNPAFFNMFFHFPYFTDKDEYDTTKNYRLVVGDDEDDFKTSYGASTINPPGHSSYHATFIAGIIDANRQNNVGIKGVADNVLLMPVVISKEAPSRDKDMAFAIHYAVDNGAFIINLSMGDSISDHVKEMMEAFDYASSHGVLIVNSAGNDGLDMDNDLYEIGRGSGNKPHDEYIRIGSSTTLLNDSLVSSFSNFGKNSVDLFAPGTAIYSTIPGNKYDFADGTSLSCPIVVGVAALLKSYFPTLTAKQIKEIIMKSVFKPDLMVNPPVASGLTNKIPFSQMSKSGGIVNAYNAVKLADEITKKKK